MPEERLYYVYIMSSYHRTLYVGVTGELYSRVIQHQAAEDESYTKKYKCFLLVYYEEFEYPNEAIAREKQLKGWRRSKKISLIEELNPIWRDMSKDFVVND